MSLLRLLCPLARVESVLDIPVEWVVARGYRGVVLDVDNTIVPWNTNRLSEQVAEWVRCLTRAGVRICLVSNSGGVQRVRELADMLKIDCVTLAVKPRRRAFRLALEKLGTSTKETIGIGDQIFTDVLGGNRMGLTTILVRPIAPRDFILTRFVRLAERLMLNLLDRKGMLRKRLGNSG